MPANSRWDLIRGLKGYKPTKDAQCRILPSMILCYLSVPRYFSYHYSSTLTGAVIILLRHTCSSDATTRTGIFEHK